MIEVFVIVCLGVVTAMIAARKGRSPVGWWLYGTLLCIVALPHALLARDLTRQPCPECAEPVRSEAVICPHCRSEIPLLLTRLADGTRVPRRR